MIRIKQTRNIITNIYTRQNKQLKESTTNITITNENHSILSTTTL